MHSLPRHPTDPGRTQVISAAAGLVPFGAVCASTNLVSAQAFQPPPGVPKAPDDRADPCPGQTNLARGSVVYHWWPEGSEGGL